MLTTALMLAVLSADRPSVAELSQHKLLLSVAGFGALAVDGPGPTPVGGAVEFGFELLPQVRGLIIASLVNLASDSTVGIGEPLFRTLIGGEVVATPLLPFELAAGFAFGVGDVPECNGGEFCQGAFRWTVQPRLFVGYRPTPRFAVGLLASWNTYVSTQLPSWFELGARVTLRL